MENPTSLIEVVRRLASLDSNHTIYALRPWSHTSRAVVMAEPESGGVPDILQHLGLAYFIEVSIATEFLEDWKSNLNFAPTPLEQCKRLIDYAINDA